MSGIGQSANKINNTVINNVSTFEQNINNNESKSMNKADDEKTNLGQGNSGLIQLPLTIQKNQESE